jgi:uncharacterized protein YydD (DUF2326 family)
MFLKSLVISKNTEIIREINFKKGLNLIVDETVQKNKDTGNGIGKTTVLRLIDFCLGKDLSKSGIYADPENPKKTYEAVKKFLTDNNVLITLVLTENLDNPTANEIVIKRNFITQGLKKICQINEKQRLTEGEFEEELKKLIFPNHLEAKPTFRQAISHNMRYEEKSITQTLKTLGAYGKNSDYEPLHLFWLGCDTSYYERKQIIEENIKYYLTLIHFHRTNI